MGPTRRMAASMSRGCSAWPSTTTQTTWRASQSRRELRRGRGKVALRVADASRSRPVPRQRYRRPIRRLRASQVALAPPVAREYPGDPWTFQGQRVPPDVIALTLGPAVCGYGDLLLLSIGKILGQPALTSDDARRIRTRPSEPVRHHRQVRAIGRETDRRRVHRLHLRLDGVVDERRGGRGLRVHGTGWRLGTMATRTRLLRLRRLTTTD